MHACSAPLFRLKSQDGRTEYAAFANIIDYLVVFDASRRRLTNRQMMFYSGTQSARETLAYALRFLVNMDMYLPKVEAYLTRNGAPARPAIATKLLR